MKPSRKPSTQLAAEQRKLQLAEEDLRKKERELQKKIKAIPAIVREKREETRTMQRIYATTTAQAEYITRVQHQRGGGGPSRRPLRTAQRRGKWQFLILCVIFITLVVLLWYALPS